jgi:hypothetical protein
MGLGGKIVDVQRRCYVRILYGHNKGGKQVGGGEARRCRWSEAAASNA